MLNLRQAIDIYMSEAYGDHTIPEGVSRLLKDLEHKLANPRQLIQDDSLEHPEADMIVLRLGNSVYPHMKLVVRFSGDTPVFSVDTHDGPDRIPPTLPGYDAFRPVIASNELIKYRIQEKLKVLTGVGERKSIQECGSKGDILVVDDEAFVGEIMTRLLGSMGFQVHYAASAGEGYKLITRFPFVCCFLDIMMPEESGYEFLEKITRERNRSFPVIFVTGMHPDNIRHELADDTILKPFTRAMLRDRLERLGLFQTGS